MAFLNNIYHNMRNLLYNNQLSSPFTNVNTSLKHFNHNNKLSLAIKTIKINILNNHINILVNNKNGAKFPLQNLMALSTLLIMFPKKSKTNSQLCTNKISKIIWIMCYNKTYNNSFNSSHNKSRNNNL